MLRFCGVERDGELLVSCICFRYIGSRGVEWDLSGGMGVVWRYKNCEWTVLCEDLDVLYLVEHLRLVVWKDGMEG